MSRNCPIQTISGFSLDYILCQYSSEAGGIKIKDGFKFADTQGDPPTLRFTIPYLANPRSQVTSGMFNVTVFDANDAVLYRFNSTNGPTVTMTKYGEPYTITYGRTSTRNGVNGNYTWRIQPLSYLKNGDRF